MAEIEARLQLCKMIGCKPLANGVRPLHLPYANQVFVFIADQWPPIPPSHTWIVLEVVLAANQHAREEVPPLASALNNSHANVIMATSQQWLPTDT